MTYLLSYILGKRTDKIRRLIFYSLSIEASPAEVAPLQRRNFKWDKSAAVRLCFCVVGPITKRPPSCTRKLTQDQHTGTIN